MTEAKDYLGGNVAATTSPLPGRQHNYDYDSIGNRNYADRSGATAGQEGTKNGFGFSVCG